MARAVEWAGRAKSDLRLVVEYIHRDSPESAKVFLSQDEVHPEAVWIMRVLHTSQDVLLALGRRTREEAEGEE